MIQYLINFLHWLQAWTWQDWTILILAVVLIAALLLIILLARILRGVGKVGEHFVKKLLD